MLEKFRNIVNKKGVFASFGELLSFIKNNPQFKHDIEEVYYQIKHRKLHGCSNCVADAFIELCTLKENEIKEHMECRFRLRAGVLIMNEDGRKNISNYNITDAGAIEALATDKTKIELFEKYPDTWEKEVETYIADGQEQVEIAQEPSAPKRTYKRKPRNGK